MSFSPSCAAVLLLAVSAVAISEGQDVQSVRTERNLPVDGESIEDVRSQSTRRLEEMPVCNCFNGVAALWMEESNPENGCYRMDQHKCEYCNPHHYLGDDQQCHACAVGKYNLFVQFDPSHQHGVYGKTSEYYPMQSMASNVSKTTCVDDVAETFCSALSFNESVGESETEQLCTTGADCEEKCNGLHNCAYIASLNECHLRDSCVRKAKRSCRSAAHCRWDMDVGRCFQLGIGTTAVDEIYLNNGLSDSDCNKKSFNGCINDFYCKWHDEKPVPGSQDSGPLEQCTCMVCGGGSECSTCAKCGEDETCISDESANGCYGVSSSGSTAGGCNCATKVWTPKPVLPVAYPKGHNPMARCMLHPCRQFSKDTCGGGARTEHFWKQSDGSTDVKTYDNVTKKWVPKGKGSIAKKKKGENGAQLTGADMTRCAWNDKQHRCDTIQNSWSKVSMDADGNNFAERVSNPTKFWKWSTDLVVPRFFHSMEAPAPPAPGAGKKL